MNKGIKAEFKQYWDVELGVTYIPWSKVREAQVEELREGGILDVDTLSPGKTDKKMFCWSLESRRADNVNIFAKPGRCLSFLAWASVRKTLELPEEPTHNGRSEPQLPEETQLLPVTASIPPAQVNNSYSLFLLDKTFKSVEAILLLKSFAYILLVHHFYSFPCK